MDFSHSHVDLLTGTILKRWSEHTKYVNQAKFSPDGDFFITGSYDHTLRIYSFHGLQLLKVFYFQGNVESTCFSNDSQTLIVGVRGDNYLHYINMATFDDVKVNMNSNGDDWVSFTPMDISMHPSGKYILISTDASQILLMKFGSSVHVKRFYGLATDAYSMPRNCWHSSGTIFFAVGDDSLIYVFDVASECVLTTLKGHNGVVRALKYDERTDLLITGSFDNSIKVWANECIMNSK
ncbi:YVTN repeat-like/Quino protein amine dehydrogenase [Rozella allomycis CSF55]|uniref:YVTN repeat-like/Quino protein amine dehydrogenase n=1 Tax=Rozella allomycis (strain CSF55) TaxID=988480 RepID=A0A075AWB0_ROZAC|nr:hypothetical protein O9G_004411 [Rozella allomycis CSF55]RKP17237.1 YVTN repeat-like/Quino protein amine dehydrogenase [Rozella allomycis CSF55]|eukprot:EPZ32997.1 hypothetical protein O9G_004411 [Rozella allomycis CSF55]